MLQYFLMKQYLLFLSLLFIGISPVIAQDDEEQPFLTKDESTGDYAFEEVIQIPNVKKEELFDRAKKWILATMKTADNNITFDDKEYSAVNTGAIKIDPKSFFTVAVQQGAFDF